MTKSWPSLEKLQPVAFMAMMCSSRVPCSAFIAASPTRASCGGWMLLCFGLAAGLLGSLQLLLLAKLGSRNQSFSMREDKTKRRGENLSPGLWEKREW